MVTDVRIRGGGAVPGHDVVPLLLTHSDNWSLKDRKPLLDDAELATDARRVESIYASKGFFQARIVDYGADRRPDRTAHVWFRVVEGAATRVARLDVEGLDDGGRTEPEALRRLAEIRRKAGSLVGLRRGDVWSDEAWQAGKSALRRALREAGFVFAEVDGQVVVSEVSGEAACRIRVDAGPLAHVRRVDIAGNHAVPTARILRRVSIAPGDVPDAKRLHRTESQIFDLGVFFAVSAEAVAPGGEALSKPVPTGPVAGAAPGAQAPPVPPSKRDPLVDVAISVQETPLHEFRTGGGVEIDDQRSEARVILGYDHHNLFGGQRFLGIQVQPAVVFLPSLWNPDTVSPGGKVDVSFRQPSFLEEYLQLNARASYLLDVQIGYRDHCVQAALGLSRKFLRVLQLDVSYDLAFYDFYQVSSLLDVPRQQLLNVTFRPVSLLTYLEETITVDLRDGKFDARNGFYGSLSVDEAAAWLGSDYNYVRLVGDVRGYWTPLRFLTLAARFKYGQTFPTTGSQTPIPARFIGGGVSDNRGFAAQRMGPYLCPQSGGNAALKGDMDTCAGSVTDRVYVGGNLQVLASAELRFYLPWHFGLVAFVDAGEIWAETSQAAWRDLQVAAGPGLRYFTPFGPIRADFGILATSPAAPSLVFHFSIGQAF